MKNTLLLLAAFLLSLSTNAQSWQWAKRGGTTSTSINNNYEEVYDMTTDKWGNVYVVALTNATDIDIDGHLLPDGNGFDNVVVASWDCNGAYRWAKFIGSTEGWKPNVLRTDTLGGLYLTGHMSSTNPGTLGSAGYFSIGVDTNFGYTNKCITLIKLDSAGNYQWARLPQADTVNPFSYSTTGVIDMDVEPDGTIHWLTVLPPGAFANGQFVIGQPTGVLPFDLYMLRYDRFGNYQSLMKPQIQPLTNLSLNSIFFRYNSKRKVYHFGGTSNLFTRNSITFGGIMPKGSYYVTAYSQTGNMLWFREGTDTFGSVGSRPCYDEQGNVYIAGGNLPGDTFQGYVFTNNSSYSTFPFWIKLDSNGSLVKIFNGKTSTTTNAFASVAYSEGVLGGLGDYSGPVTFDNLHLLNFYNSTGRDIFMTRFDAATGALLSLDSAKSSLSTEDYSSAMTADNKGNFYVGGRVLYDLSFDSNTIYSIGGTSDWFVAKYGAPNCGCTNTPPPPTFSAAIPLSGGSASFALTSPTTGIDSVAWIFGDGQRQVVTSNFTQPISHSYAAADSYGVCVEIFTPCGSSHKCQWVQVAMSVEDAVAGGDMFTLMPNPASQMVQISYRTMSSSSLEIYDVLGRRIASQKVQGGINSWNVDISGYAPGVYQVVLRSSEGKTVLHKALSIQR